MKRFPNGNLFIALLAKLGLPTNFAQSVWYRIQCHAGKVDLTKSMRLEAAQGLEEQTYSHECKSTDKHSVIAFQ